MRNHEGKFESNLSRQQAWIETGITDQIMVSLKSLGFCRQKRVKSRVIFQKAQSRNH